MRAQARGVRGVKPHERILVALDMPEPERAYELARALRGRVGGVKIGLELFGAGGPSVVRAIREQGVDVFVDLKLHDIPNTVAGAAASVARSGARWFTMHALGGSKMLRAGARAAREAAVEQGLDPPVTLAVTVLTSHDDADLAQTGIAGPCRDAVLRLARLASDAGIDGLVCSPLEIRAVRGVLPQGTLVVPGIRPGGTSRNDQARTSTPADAVEAGADLLVIGRPITRAVDPVAAADAIRDQIAQLD